MALLDTMGLKRCPGTILPMGDGIYVDGLPQMSAEALKAIPDNVYILAHVSARYDLSGFRVITVIRDPRACLISYIRHREREDGLRITVQQALESYWDWGPFVPLYQSFLGWIGRSIVMRYEDMPASMIGDGTGIYRGQQRDWNTRTGNPSQWFHVWTDEIEAVWQQHGGPALLYAAGYSSRRTTMPKKWQDVTISAGQMESDLIPIPMGDLACPPGRMRGADGTKFKGSERPRFTVVEPEAGQSKIVLNEPAPTDLVFKVKAEPEEDEDVA